jgi:hypothetical protein
MKNQHLLLLHLHFTALLSTNATAQKFPDLDKVQWM